MVNAYQVYIAISLVALVLIALIALFKRTKKSQTPPSQLAALAMSLVVLGIIFGGDNRLIGYGFLGAGVLLSVIDQINTRKTQE